VKTIVIPPHSPVRNEIMTALHTGKTLQVGPYSIRMEEQADQNWAYVLRLNGMYLREYSSSGKAANALLIDWAGAVVEVIGPEPEEES
jgi:hypothetical protein